MRRCAKELQINSNANVNNNQHRTTVNALIRLREINDFFFDTANYKGFKRFGAFKGLVEQKNVVFNSFVSKLGQKSAKKGPIYTQTRQINYYYDISGIWKVQ
jgi:hypothetical protein